jgi:DNA-3-methyladenine glycosylase II
MWQETITIQGPYRFNHVLDRLSLDPLNFIDLEKLFIRIPMYIQKKKCIVTIQGIGTVDHPQFLVFSEDHKDEILKEVSRIFQWNVPLVEVTKHFESTNLAQLVAKHEGTPLVLDMNPYLSLMKCIIHQQLNMSFAFTLTKRLVENFGEEVDGVWFYPLPEKVASLNYEELRDLQFSQRKAEYVIDTSRLIANGELSIGDLVTMSNEEIENKLIKIRGIGQWTIQNLLLFGLGRQNMFPKADIGIQNAMKIYFHLEQKPTYEQMDELSKGWDPYLSYASLYLWRSLETKK